MATHALRLESGAVFEIGGASAAAPWPRAALLRSSKIDTVAVVDEEIRAAFRDATPGLLAEVAGETHWVTILVAWREPPAFGRRREGRVRSFIAAGEIVRQLAARHEDAALPDLLYLLLHDILNRTVNAPSLRVRQIGGPTPRPVVSSPSSPSLATRIALIMAHRGEPGYLATALDVIDRAACRSMLTVRVGLDEESTESYGAMARREHDCEMFAVDTPPVART